MTLLLTVRSDAVLRRGRGGEGSRISSTQSVIARNEVTWQSLPVHLYYFSSPPRPLSPSVFKGVRISFFQFFFINTLKDGILTSHKTLLRMTEGVDGILTSHKTLLRMTEWWMGFSCRPAKNTGFLRMTTRSAICYIYIKNYSKIGGKEWIFKKSFLTCSF